MIKGILNKRSNSEQKSWTKGVSQHKRKQSRSFPKLRTKLDIQDCDNWCLYMFWKLTCNHKKLKKIGLKTKPTGLLTAIPPSIMLKCSISPTAWVWGSFFVRSFFFLSSVGGTVKYTGGKNVGAAVVARHTSFTKAAFNLGCSTIETQDQSSSDCASTQENSLSSTNLNIHDLSLCT